MILNVYYSVELLVVYANSLLVDANDRSVMNTLVFDSLIKLVSTDFENLTFTYSLLNMLFTNISYDNISLH